MAPTLALVALFALGVSPSYGVPSAGTVPTVTLDEGVFYGESEGNINKFLGIPFAKPP